MIHDVKVFKPNENGELVQTEIIPGKEATILHWSTFRSDTNRSAYKKTAVKYHRIGGPSKKCIEEDCDVIIEDARRKICSIACKTRRLNRQRQASKINRKEK